MWYRSRNCREQDLCRNRLGLRRPDYSSVAPMSMPPFVVLGTPLGSAEDRLARASLLHLVACTAIRVARFSALLAPFYRSEIRRRGPIS